ncbi:translocase of chloroplast 159, chloroplastic [Cynara cardunculus var. scolymus]|uniref:AIG1-like protein n=1 Tax=Cynara cardunculus var. scolymus TaxID=59895 RepID=A0A103XPB4_CYNCS|nr:translocase of chloroplast 159, chloroplastic [Cynara cardunculus var. scolymus]KVH94474.1 AIG1-like protein [Cynara cardunculus var. scolymus]
MEPKEDVSLSGFSSVSSDKIETVDETNVSKSVDNNNNNGVSRLDVNSDDENEGFASGEEEAFETNLDENLETLVNVDEGDSFLETSEFPISKVESETVSDEVVVDDDAEKGNLVVEGLNSDELVKQEVLEGSEGDKVGEIKEDVVDETVSKVVSSDEVKSEVVAENGVKVTTEGDSIVEKVEIDTPAPGVVVVANTEEDEDEDEDEDDVVLVGGPDNSKPVVEASELESNGGNDVKVTSEGDSVVEAIDVDLPVAGVVGVAVVNKKDEDGVAAADVKLDQVLEEVVDKEVVGVTDGSFSPLDVEDSGGFDVEKSGKNLEAEVEKEVDYEGKENGSVVKSALDDVETVSPVDLQGDASLVTEVLDKGVPDEAAPVTEVLDKDVPEDGAQKMEILDKDLPDDGAQKTEILDKELPDGGAQKTEILDKELPDDGVQKTHILDRELPDDGAQRTEVLDKDLPDDGAQATESSSKDIPDMGVVSGGVEDNGLENGPADKFVLEESAEKDDAEEEGYMDGSPSDEDTDGVIFGSSEAAKQFMEELERGSGEGGGSNTGGESSQDRSQMIDGQIVTDSDEDDDEEDGKELFDSAALAALLKAAADGGSEGGNITFSSQDGSRLFTIERPAGLGPSLQTMRAAPRPNRANIFNPSSLMTAGETDSNLSEEERKKLETLQSIRVKFLRLVQRLGLSPDESVAAQVLYRLALIAGRQTGQSFSLDAAKRKAVELEADGNGDLDFSVNILVIGKAGVGKSATINSIFGEEKTVISAFKPATSSVKEIRGMVGGVMIRVFDTPGLRSSVMDQGFNRHVLASAKKFTKKNPPDIVLYVDRLDAQTRDHNDIPLLKTITTSLGPAIWRSAIVTFTHGASAPPEGSNGIPLSYEMFVTQRSHVVQQAIGHAVGDLRMMSPSLMNPVSLVENHQSCRKNREGQKVLPNGQTWRPQLLMLCYSMKILAEANSLSKPQDPYDNRKLFGFRVRSPPLPYMLSSMLQSRAHPKLSSEQGGDGGDSDVDLADLSDSDQEEDEDEYDQLPPFKPLKKSQLSKLSREQRKAYFDEYDYRVKLLQKKQWKEELKRMKEMKKRGKDAITDQPYPEEEGEGDAPAPVAVPLPDMALPPSFDSDNAAYRFRFLEPTSQFLARPVLDTHGWDHDCGYDGVNLEQSLAIASRFPAAVSVQITKDKKDFSINLDSSVSAKHGEKGSSMAGFDIQPIGKQLAYIVRGETKFKNLKKNKTAAGMSVTFLGENVVTGFKVEDQIAFGKQYSLLGSAGTVRFQSDSAYGANIEVQRRELDYPIGQVQSTVGLSIIKWKGDLALGFNSLAQFSAGRNSKVAVRAGINNKMSGQITVKTSSSEHLSLALAAVLPSVISAYKKFWSSYGEKNSAY